MAAGDAIDEGKVSAGDVVGEHHGGDAGGICAEGEHEEVEHEGDVFAKVSRDSWGGWLSFGRGAGFPAGGARFGGKFDASLNGANGIKILVEFELVIASQFAPKLAGIFEDKVEKVLEFGGFGGLACKTPAEQPFIDKPRIDFPGNRSRWGLPGDVRAVESCVADVTVDAADDRFGPQFQRRQWRELTGVLSDQLVNGNPSAADVFSSCFCDWHSRQEVGSFGVMPITTVAVFLVEAGEYEGVLPDFCERLQGGAESVVRSCIFGDPRLLPDSVGEVDECRSQWWFC